MVPLGDEAQVEARFGLFGDSVVLDTRSVRWEIVLDAPDGTPR